MCDTLCVIGADRTLFAKNSDRSPNEPQVLESYPRRNAGGTLRTTYLEIDDAGAHALVGSRPSWMWGLEHGVNEHRVAIGNERIYTIDDPHTVPPALVGMDLVRLGLERGSTADEAVDAIVGLLEQHGQGGSGAEGHDDPYWSSFLVADPDHAWVVETSARTWAAREVDHGAAISNRVTLTTDWGRASTDVPAGADFDRWRDQQVPTGLADGRLATTSTCVATGAAALTAADLVATMRHHGTGPWGAPDDPSGRVEPPPPADAPSWDSISVCFHYGVATTASMIAELPHDSDARPRAWVALGSPCASVYVPVFPPDVPSELADPATWMRFRRLRERVESDPDALTAIRQTLAPVERALWAKADGLPADDDAQRAFAVHAWDEVACALTTLGV
jgi:secernin